MRAEPSSSQTVAPGRQTGRESRFHPTTIFKAFAVIAAISFLLRIFYAGHLFQDDGLWFTVGEELLRGKMLYRDIYFDKPPAIALVYAGLFKLFGAHILTIRLFTICYCIVVSATLYVFGKRFYDERTGLIAAAMFAIFSTLFTTGHVQGLNTDLLMTLPYTAGAYWLMRSRGDVLGHPITRRQSAGFALAGGAGIGLATQVNPKGAFDFVFYILFLLLVYLWQRMAEQRGRGAGELDGRQITAASRFPAVSLSPLRLGSPASLLIFSLAGFVAAALPFLIYLAANGALSFYWRYVWDWGARYAAYYPVSRVITIALGQTAMYFLLNHTLLIALLFVAVTTYKRARRAAAGDTKKAAEADSRADTLFRADVALLLWFAVSFVAMSVGGRFFGHYFFQILPGLCLIGARGIPGMLAALSRKAQSLPLRDEQAGDKRRAQRPVWLYGLIGLLVVGFAVTLVRFHTRTVVLAADWLRGANSESTRRWFHERLNTEERLVAATVRNLETEPAEAAEQLGLEAMRRSGPRDSRERSPAEPSDYLFVWGYRPEIYYWSGLLPASKYLSTQALTGVPADVHYFGNDYHSVLDAGDTAAARQELAQELARTQPEYIVDELGFFNDDLAMMRYEEFAALMSGYKNIGSVGRFIIYRRRDFIKARKREKQERRKGRGAEEKSRTGEPEKQP